MTSVVRYLSPLRIAAALSGALHQESEEGITNMVRSNFEKLAVYQLAEKQRLRNFTKRLRNTSRRIGAVPHVLTARSSTLMTWSPCASFDASCLNWPFTLVVATAFGI